MKTRLTAGNHVYVSAKIFNLEFMVAVNNFPIQLRRVIGL